MNKLEITILEAGRTTQTVAVICLLTDYGSLDEGDGSADVQK